MSESTCYFLASTGPTMGEMATRAELIAMALQSFAWGMLMDRAAMWALDENRQRTEHALMTNYELTHGHWVHTTPHSGECPDK